MSEDTTQSRHRGFYLLPNLLTISALFAGFYAIVSAMNGHYRLSAIAIYISIIFDGLDGRVARLTNSQTPFGAELDSLSDMVSFGITPALAVYCWGLQMLPKFGWLAVFIFAVGVALRLARFNTQLEASDTRYFIGLPSPAAAAVLASIVWVGGKYQLTNNFLNSSVALVTVCLGLLMVSNIPYRSFKDVELIGKVPFMTILAFVFLLVFVSISPAEILLAIFSTYALSGPLFALHRRANNKD